MDINNLIVAVLIGAPLGLAIYQWRLWEGRARNMVEVYEKNKQTLLTLAEQWNNLQDERKRDFNAMMEVFDFLNDNQPFGSHDEGLRQCKNVLLHAIQNSTYGRDGGAYNDQKK